MHRMVRTGAVTVGLILLAISSVCSRAHADADKIAQVKNASGQVTIMRDGAGHPAKAGDFLYEKDVVKTGSDGAIGITFSDNTSMSTGPNSEVSLDQYQFDSSNFHGSMLTDMRKGTLAMISGDIARSSPGAMRIKTPTAMLGVRGTRFVVQVP